MLFKQNETNVFSRMKITGRFPFLEAARFCFCLTVCCASSETLWSGTLPVQREGLAKRLAQRKFLTTKRAIPQQREGLVFKNVQMPP